jgi:hypothetical protein
MSEAAWAAALLDPAQPCPPGLRSWNQSDPAQRMAVHRNNVTVSLVDALAEQFPVVLALVGDDFFRAMARLYVRDQPPRSCVLARHGAGLPGFIAGFAPAASLPYLADVARLELLRCQASQAADAPPLQALGSAVLAALQHGSRAAGLRLDMHPSVAVLDSPHAVVSLWAAHQGQDILEAIDTGQAEAALVLRPDMEVLVLRLPPGGAALVQQLLQGDSLGDAAAQALAAAPGFDLTTNLLLLLQHGAVCAIHLPGEGTP